MNSMIQHLLVLLLVLACVAVVGVQAFASLRGKKSRLGSCCAKGCDAGVKVNPAKERVVFLPVELLSRKGK
jgi:hypothetical protein